MAINKLFAMIIASIMLVSVFSVFAHGQEESTGSDDDAKLDDAVSDAVVETASAGKGKSIKQTIEERVAKKKELLERAKKVREETRESLNVARDELKEAREKVRESKKELQSLKGDAEKCKGVSSDECKKVRKDTKARTAKFVDGSIEQIFRMLQKAKSAVEKSSEMSDDQKAQFVSDLDAKLVEISAMRQKQGQIQAQNTAQEIRDAAKNIKEFWKQSKDAVKQNNARISIAKFGGVIKNAEKLQERLNKKIEEFKSEGKDVAVLEAQITVFAEKLAAAKELSEEASSWLDSADASQDKSDAMKQATGKMRQAHGQLKEARAVLAQIKAAFDAQESLSAGLQE